MAAFWAVFTIGGSGPTITVHGSLNLKQEIQIQIQIQKSKDSSKTSNKLLAIVGKNRCF
jgi:hypothetical protein